MSLPLKFLSGALPSFGAGVGQGLDGCVTAHWIWKCSVLWVANFSNTSSTEKCTMGIRTVVKMQAILSSRRSGGIEFIGVFGIFWGGMNVSTSGFVVSEWSGVVRREEIFFFFWECICTFSFWKGQSVGQVHRVNLYIFFSIVISFTHKTSAN